MQYLLLICVFNKINPPFQQSERWFELLLTMSINKFAVYKTTNIELEPETYLFRRCSVTNNLVTSLEFESIRSTIMLCHFGQALNVSVATQFILLSSTTMSRATGGYVVVFRNALNKMRNQLIEMRSRLGTSLVFSQKDI